MCAVRGVVPCYIPLSLGFWCVCVLGVRIVSLVVQGVTGELVLPRFDCCACTLYGSMYCVSVCTLYIVSCMSK